jgi:hypothetical protein
MQSTLNKWLDLKKEYYTIFYLESNLVAKFYYDLDDLCNVNKVGFKYKVCNQINDKKLNILFNIICNSDIIYDEDKKVEPYIFSKKKLLFENISFLKSHLQKSIRRGNVNNALYTAYNLMALDLNEFLRRIIIIMIEDVCLHESITLLSWLMCSYPNYKPNKIQIEWLLGVVKILTLLNYKDNIDVDVNFLEFVDVVSSNKYVYSVYLRYIYGGMCGDICLLNSTINVWQNRYKYEIKNVSNAHVESIQIKNIKLITLDDVILASVDFHCFPFIISTLNDKFPDYTKCEIKVAIWNWSSSINYRENKKCKKYKNVWLKIKNYLKIIQSNILHKYV